MKTEVNPKDTTRAEAYQSLTAQASAECKSTFLEDYMIVGTSAMLPISFQFHHTQMDGGHGATFLELLQREIYKLGIGNSR